MEHEEGQVATQLKNDKDDVEDTLMQGMLQLRQLLTTKKKKPQLFRPDIDTKSNFRLPDKDSITLSSAFGISDITEQERPCVTMEHVVKCDESNMGAVSWVIRLWPIDENCSLFFAQCTPLLPGAACIGLYTSTDGVYKTLKREHRVKPGDKQEKPFAAVFVVSTDDTGGWTRSHEVAANSIPQSIPIQHWFDHTFRDMHAATAELCCAK